VKFKSIPGRTIATDEEILEEYKRNPFINNIRKKYKISLIRLRKIIREYESGRST